MKDASKRGLTRTDFVHALEEKDTLIDVTLDDLMDINARAEKYARRRNMESQSVADTMSSTVETVQPDCSLADAAHRLVSRGISGLPVVDEKQKLVGVITEADFLQALGVPVGNHSHSVWQTLEAMFVHPTGVKNPDGIVADLMSKNVVTVTPDQTLHDVLEVMKKHKIKRLVVCDDQGHVVGMITRSDLVRTFFDQVARPCSGTAQGRLKNPPND